MRELTTDEIKSIQGKLKECKPEWLEKNAKNQDSLGVWTVQQILDNATDGLWSFVIEEQWREDVHKFDKKNNSYFFDGYVYHVRGYLVIEGIGRRSQYGSKVAIGGKDNQNSSYKSAASDCLKKCASLFGVGSSIYSKIKIETEEEQAYNQLQNDPNYAVGQPQQALQPETFTNNQGYTQSGEYVWYNNTWVHQNEFHSIMQQQQAQPMNGGQYPSLSSTEHSNAGHYQVEQNYTEPSQQQWYENTMQEHDPSGYQQMMTEQQKMQQAIQQTDQELANGSIEVPFENVPAKEQQVEATPQEFEATPQTAATPQDFQPVEYGAPAETSEKKSEKEDPLSHVVAKNPWQNAETEEQLKVFSDHKSRLNIKKDADLLPHVREFFKDESASLASITPEVLVSFNAHLQNIQV
ncbi:hypothetical protein C2I27_04255 [Priestia megaterium]|uniref:Rad52/Rad22 family DNA repair protein n=1 Tax=Priestia megaterium TaxID=1404 RepID=UPI000D510667|nr:Rad52/Rad22 family DNA repair protein [Priestia megaterium]PVC75105.1 hypothetical protein C2I27_04255 [Priestia megaterium]